MGEQWLQYSINQIMAKLFRRASRQLTRKVVNGHNGYPSAITKRRLFRIRQGIIIIQWVGNRARPRGTGYGAGNIAGDVCDDLNFETGVQHIFTGKETRSLRVPIGPGQQNISGNSKINKGGSVTIRIQMKFLAIKLSSIIALVVVPLLN